MASVVVKYISQRSRQNALHHVPLPCGPPCRLRSQRRQLPCEVNGSTTANDSTNSSTYRCAELSAAIYRTGLNRRGCPARSRSGVTSIVFFRRAASPAVLRCSIRRERKESRKSIARGRERVRRLLVTRLFVYGGMRELRMKTRTRGAWASASDGIRNCAMRIDSMALILASLC